MRLSTMTSSSEDVSIRFDAELLDVLQEAKLTVGALPFARYVIRMRLRWGQSAEAPDFALSALARTMARL